MALSTATRKAQGALAAAERHHPDDTDRLTEARREFAAAKLEDYVRQVVDSAPPLTEDQLERVTAILRPTLHAGGAA